MRSSYSNLKRVELALFAGGVLLVGIAGSFYIGGRVYSRAALARFHSAPSPGPAAAGAGLTSASRVDYSLWSPKRIERYKASFTEHFDQPLAVLRIDKIHMEVPIFEGTSDLVLDRGAGWIQGTARVGEAGNIGIAGHRDGFFRGLKDVSVGDTLQLETAAGTQAYMVDSIRLVDPHDESVLKNTAGTAITLVTCFPFYYVGSAPQRYIVHASLKGKSETLNESAKASSQATASRSKENHNERKN